MKTTTTTCDYCHVVIDDTNRFRFMPYRDCLNYTDKKDEAIKADITMYAYQRIWGEDVCENCFLALNKQLGTTIDNLRNIENKSTI